MFTEELLEKIEHPVDTALPKSWCIWCLLVVSTGETF